MKIEKYKFSVERDDELDAEIIENYQPYFPSTQRMKESRRELEQSASISKMKYGISTNEDRIVVVTDSKEYSDAQEFCGHVALLPVRNLAEVLTKIDEIIQKRENAEMNEMEIKDKEMTESNNRDEVHTEVKQLQPQEKEQEPEQMQKPQKLAVDSMKAEKLAKKKQSPVVNVLENNMSNGTNGKLAELLQNPLYQCKKEKDGHYIIAESLNSDLKLKVYGEGGRSDLTKGAYVYAKTHAKAGRAKRLSLADISKGGTALSNFMLEFGNAFTMADISVACNRLWLLNELGNLDMIDLEPKLDMQGIHSFYMRKIAEDLKE